MSSVPTLYWSVPPPKFPDGPRVPTVIVPEFMIAPPALLLPPVKGKTPLPVFKTGNLNPGGIGVLVIGREGMRYATIGRATADRP